MSSNTTDNQTPSPAIVTSSPSKPKDDEVNKSGGPNTHLTVPRTRSLSKSKSMNDTASVAAAVQNEDYPSAIYRLKTEEPPICMEQARERRASIKQERKDIICMIRHRTALRAADLGISLDVLKDRKVLFPADRLGRRRTSLGAKSLYYGEGMRSGNGRQGLGDASFEEEEEADGGVSGSGSGSGSSGSGSTRDSS